MNRMLLYNIAIFTLVGVVIGIFIASIQYADDYCFEKEKIELSKLTCVEGCTIACQIDSYKSQSIVLPDGEIIEINFSNESFMGALNKFNGSLVLGNG